MPSGPESNPGVSSETEHLLAFLADRDAPCPVCDYSLRGLTAPICPECGAALARQLGSPQIRVGAWALAMVSFALGLGFDGVVSVVLLTALVISPAQQWEPYGIVTLFLALSGGMGMGLLWLGRRRASWTKRPVRQQWLRGGGVFLAVGLLHGLVGAGFVLVAQF